MYVKAKKIININIRQITRWLIASKQDSNPAVAMLHANYAVADIDMLRQQFSDDVVKKYSGLDVLKLHNEATALQDKAQKELRKKCVYI